MMRIAGSLLLLLLGCGAIVIGAWFHVLPVIEEKQREISVVTATPFEMPLVVPQQTGQSENPFAVPPSVAKPAGEAAGDPFGSSASPGMAAPRISLFDETPLPELPPGAPASESLRDALTRKITETYYEIRHEPEWLLTREMTVGGVTRLSNGQLKQTYSGKPPALCPT